jgi:hypothetical protein
MHVQLVVHDQGGYILIGSVSRLHGDGSTPKSMADPSSVSVLKVGGIFVHKEEIGDS